MSAPRLLALTVALVLAFLCGSRACAATASIVSATIPSAQSDYVPGQSLLIQVTFDDTVVVTGSPAFLLNASSSATASYVSGSGTTQLTFAYLVGSTDHTPSPTVLDIDTAVTLAGSGPDSVTAQTDATPASWGWPLPSGNLTPSVVIAPTVQAITLSAGAIASASAPGSVTCTLVGSEAFSGVAAGSLTLSGAAASGASVGGFTASGTAVTCTIGNLTASGPLTVTLSSATGIHDGDGNVLDLAHSVTSATTTVLPVPVLQAITTTTASPTASTSATFLLAFNVPVIGVTPAALTWSGPSVATTTVTPASGPASVWTVTALGISGSGTLGLTFANPGGVTDTTGHAVAASTPSPDQTVTIDQTPPTITALTATPASIGPNDSGTRTYTVSFSTSVTGFTAASCSVATTGSASATVAGVTLVSASQYQVQLGACHGSGTVQLVISPAGITDGLGNPLGSVPAAPICNVVPVPVLTAPGPSGPTNATTLALTFPANVALTGTDPSAGMSLQLTGGVSASISGVSASGSHLIVLIGPISGNGTLAVVVPATLTGVTDTAGDAVTAAIGTTAPITIDQTPPSITAITLASASPTNAASVSFQVAFSESVTGVSTASFTPTGTVGGSIAAVSPGGAGTTALVTVTGIGGSGTLGIAAVAAPGITDLAGNALTATVPATDATCLVEQAAPTLVAIATSDPNPAGVPGTVHFLATFSVPVVNVTPADFAVTGSLQGSPTIAVAALGATPASAWLITVGGLALPSGTTSTVLALTFANASGVQDQVGNAASSLAPATDSTYTLVTQLPSVTAAGAVTYVEQGTPALPYANAILSDSGRTTFVDTGQTGGIDASLAVPGTAAVAPHTISSDPLDQLWPLPGATSASAIWSLDPPVVVGGTGVTASTTTSALRLSGAIVGSVRYTFDQLHVAFTAPVLTSQVQALIGCLSYFNPGNNPSNSNRQVALTVTDGLGRVSGVTTVQVTMVLINDTAPLAPNLPLINASPAARIVSAGGTVSGHIATNDVDSYFTCVVIDGNGTPHAASLAAPAVVATAQGTVTVQLYGDWQYTASATASGIDSFAIQVTDIGPGAGNFTGGEPLLPPATITQSVYCIAPQGPTLQSPQITSNPPVEAEVGAVFSYTPSVTDGVDAYLTRSFDLVDLDGNGWVTGGFLVIDPDDGTVSSPAPLPTTASGYVEVGILYQVTDQLGVTRATYQPLLLRLVSSASGGG